jgi:hypothetical protein
MSDQPKAKLAADVIYDNLARIPHPQGMVRLVQFSHDSPGLRAVRRQIAEGLVMLLESQGWHLCNGLSEAEALLTDNGYAVLAPADDVADSAAI